MRERLGEEAVNACKVRIAASVGALQSAGLRECSWECSWNVPGIDSQQEQPHLQDGSTWRAQLGLEVLSKPAVTT